MMDDLLDLLGLAFPTETELFAANPSMGRRIKVRKIGVWLPVTQEELDEHRDFLERVRAFNALPPQEKARLSAEREERHAREKAERTCPHCGCDPDEHGGW